MPTTRHPDGGLTYTTIRDGKRTSTTVVNPSTCKGCAKVWCHTCSQPKCYIRQETEWPADVLATTYQREYLDKEVPNERVRHRDPYIKSLAQLSDQTTNKADYVPMRAFNERKTQSARKPLVPRPFDDTTSYRVAHPPKSVPVHVKKQPPVDDYQAPFYGVSSYNADYIKKPLSERLPAQPPLEGFNVPFDGTSTYRDDYLRKQMPQLERHRRNALVPSRHTVNSTTYGTDYIELPLTRKGVDFCCENPAHPAYHVQLLERPDGRPWTPCCSSCEQSRAVTPAYASRPGTLTPAYASRPAVPSRTL